MKKFIIYILVCVPAIWFQSCSNDSLYDDKVGLLARYNGEDLYLKDVLKDKKWSDLSAEDSTKYVNDAIAYWLKEAVILNYANRVKIDNDEVESLVNSYRESILKSKFKDIGWANLMEGGKIVKDSEIQSYYENNRSLFVVKAPLMQSVLVRMPTDNSVEESIRSLSNEKSSSMLLDFCKKNHIEYMDYSNGWTPLSRFNLENPLKVVVTEEDLKSKIYNLSDSLETYYLITFAFIPTGGMKSLSTEKDRIREILTATKKQSFLLTLEDSLYKRELENNKIELYSTKQN